VARQSPILTTYDRTPVVELTRPGIRGRDVVLKRAFDAVVATLLLIVLSPLMLVVALLVKRSSPGPALFRQERVGYSGRRFRIFKFRSMCDNAEERLEELRDDSIYEDQRLFKVVHDPRVTQLGRFLRRSSLDELPQLFNVLGGSMSLVGPRPPLPSEVAQYGDSSFLRFDVKPGITGPWQVNGRNAITSFDEVIALEAAYVNGWTIWRDFSILARTVPVVLKMTGAH
jgi:exopolysaccharide biosynthesis polyprenyl glycosylphosphotransferase